VKGRPGPEHIPHLPFHGDIQAGHIVLIDPASDPRLIGQGLASYVIAGLPL